jgi:leucyl aminopeptidase
MLSVISAAAQLQLPINISALLPCVENMPGGKSFKPGDVIKSFSGKTVEIIDTDAEGRLILADALSYALSFKPELIIDAATLTGAVVVALGYHHTGLISNDDALAEALLDAGKKAQDLAWRLPINEDYQAQIDSKLADVANLGQDRSAGSITAACFLARFVDKTRWAHLDIAGTAMQKGANSGRPVSLLVQYFIDYAAQVSKPKTRKATKK